MRLCIVGAGYVGLVTGACFAEFGHSVVCVDSDRNKIETLTNGRVPIFEPGLDELIGANVEAQRLSFSRDLTSSVANADAVFIAVGTPPRDDDGWPDLSSIYQVARLVAPALQRDAIVVVKSTVPIGTGDEIEHILSDARPDADLTVVSNPEFLRAGSAVDDFQRPDRIVVGTDDADARAIMRRIYAPLVARNRPILFTSRRSSELIKYASNALLATKIAFINEVAELCERAHADILEVSHGVGLDERIGAQFLNAGPGFGGSCFRKDALALARMGERYEAPMRIVESVLHANECRKRGVVRKVAAAIGKPLRASTIAVLGLTFKANTDDMREAPSITLISSLVQAGARVRAYDPAGMETAKAVLPSEVAYARTPYEAANKADALVLLTDWPQFRNLDFARIARQLDSPVVIDMRNLFDGDSVVDRGLQYFGVGRSARRAAAAALPNKRTGAGAQNANGFPHTPPPMKWPLSDQRAETRVGTNGRRTL
jgi:UDPglucose 6-dehydrogenase